MYTGSWTTRPDQWNTSVSALCHWESARTCLKLSRYIDKHMPSIVLSRTRPRLETWACNGEGLGCCFQSFLHDRYNVQDRIDLAKMYNNDAYTHEAILLCIPLFLRLLAGRGLNEFELIVYLHPLLHTLFVHTSISCALLFLFITQRQQKKSITRT